MRGIVFHPMKRQPEASLVQSSLSDYDVSCAHRVCTVTVSVTVAVTSGVCGNDAVVTGAAVAVASHSHAAMVVCAAHPGHACAAVHAIIVAAAVCAVVCATAAAETARLATT